jgi:Tol biopolymer transport system component
MPKNARRAIVGVVAVAALFMTGCRPSPWRAELMSESAEGGGAADGRSAGPPVFSPDGTKLAFVSQASDLGPTDTNGVEDVYIRDLATGEVTLVSVNAAGTDSADHVSYGPVFSGDGTKVAFTSAAGDLGGNDPNQMYDVYVRDLTTGTTSLVSVNEAGTAAGSSSSFGASFGRADGTLVAFSSTADDLVAEDAPRPPGGGDGSDVFVRDLRTDTTTLVSLNAAGTASGNGDSGGGSFSPDGSKVTFDSYATDLAPGDTNGDWVEDVYVRDLATGTTTLVSVNAAGTASGNGQSGDPIFGPDSRHIGFHSTATDLVAGTDTNGQFDAFVRDLATGTTTLVSVNAAGTGAGNGQAFLSAFTPDGDILFSGSTWGLGPTDTNSQYDVYLRDLAAETTTLVSVNAAGTDSGNAASLRPSASARDTIAFESTATDLGPTDTNTCLRWPSPPLPPTSEPCTDVYVRDMATGKTTLVSARAGGGDSAAGDSGQPAITRNGHRIAFVSSAADLGPPDSNGLQDIYLARRRR